MAGRFQNFVMTLESSSRRVIREFCCMTARTGAAMDAFIPVRWRLPASIRALFAFAAWPLAKISAWRMFAVAPTVSSKVSETDLSTPKRAWTRVECSFLRLDSSFGDSPPPFPLPSALASAVLIDFRIVRLDLNKCIPALVPSDRIVVIAVDCEAKAARMGLSELTCPSGGTDSAVVATSARSF